MSIRMQNVKICTHAGDIKKKEEKCLLTSNWTKLQGVLSTWIKLGFGALYFLAKIDL